jgi:hypothetical protein
MTNRDKIIICDRRVVFNLWLAGWNGREGWGVGRYGGLVCVWRFVICDVKCMVGAKAIEEVELRLTWCY